MTDLLAPLEQPLKASEAEMLARLRLKFAETRGGNGDAYAFVPHVRNAAGFNATRTADAIVMGLWPSRGLVLQGFEIKVSRADWLRELKKPEKAEVFCQLVDYWWVVVSDKTIVQPGELPPTWGLMVPHGKGLKVATQAKQLREPEPVSRSFLACLLRSAAKQQAAGPSEIREALEKQRLELTESHNRTYEMLERQRDEQTQRIRAFERAAGVQLDERWHGSGRTPEETGRLLRMVLNGEAQTQAAERRLRSLAKQARELAESIDRQLGDE